MSLMHFSGLAVYSCAGWSPAAHVLYVDFMTYMCASYTDLLHWTQLIGNRNVPMNKKMNAGKLLILFFFNYSVYTDFSAKNLLIYWFQCISDTTISHKAFFGCLNHLQSYRLKPSCSWLYVDMIETVPCKYSFTWTIKATPSAHWTDYTG